MSVRLPRCFKETANPELVRRIRRETMIDVEDSLRPYFIFFLFLAMSALIATCGIAAESSAVVIGAMLISPLMAPIIGVSFAITIGKPRKALREFVISLAGAALVILVAALVFQTVPSAAPLLENKEVLSRISPRIVDMLSAIACGIVASLAVGRTDAFGTLPGVAISVSIVPPLCVAGAALAQGVYDAALGSLLLFLVNFFSIQLSCNFVFLLSGFARHSADEATSRMRVMWYGTALVGTLLLATPLAAMSNNLVVREQMQNGATAAVSAWIANRPYDIMSIDASKDDVVIELAGDENIPDINELRRLLKEHGVHTKDVKVRIVRQYS